MEDINIIDSGIYKGKFEMPYSECINFKEKEISFIRFILKDILMNEYLRFGGYGNIVFNDEDKRHVLPIISQLKEFSRSKTNCIIFDLIDCKYNKIFLSKTKYKEESFYGIILYNTETKEKLNIYNIDLDYTKLAITINRIITNKRNK